MGGFDLPPVNMKRGGGSGWAPDMDFVNSQKMQIGKFDEINLDEEEKKNENEGKSLKDLMKEKRENAEKII
jgi:hypothetical protein